MIYLPLHLKKVFRLFPVFVTFAMSLGGCTTTATSYSSANRSNLLEMTTDSDRQPRAKTLYAMARILLSQGREEQGELVLLRVIADHPRFIPAYCELAELRMGQGRLDDALRRLSQGREFSPRDPILLNNAGVCLLLKGDYSAALDYFTLAANVLPHEDRYRANMALALGMMGREDESSDLYGQVVPVEWADYNLGVIQEMRNESKSTPDELSQVQP